MRFKRNLLAFFLFLGLLAGADSRICRAQAAPAAFQEKVTLDVGGMASAFDPDYVPNKIAGAGGYVDLNLFHGVGVEAEARWLRWHGFEGIKQDNYLIGPRFKIRHFWKAQPYVKVLGGFSDMDFENHDASGRFTTVAGGGGIDIHLGHRWTVRPVDFEYQVWPKFLMSTLSPYGGSAGVSYRILSH
jgi:hypothetical protein